MEGYEAPRPIVYANPVTMTYNPTSPFADNFLSLSPVEPTVPIWNNSGGRWKMKEKKKYSWRFLPLLQTVLRGCLWSARAEIGGPMLGPVMLSLVGLMYRLLSKLFLAGTFQNLGIYPFLFHRLLLEVVLFTFMASIV